jgi:hypothetical protein
MISTALPKPVEKKLLNLVETSYQGNLETAILSLIKLHKKYGWKEQLMVDIRSIRSEVKRKGGIKAKTIDEAISKYRKNQ